jgi:uncharacterized protein YcbK (DUF882 family)
MSHAHLDERLSVQYRKPDGSYDAAVLERVAHFFRSREDGKVGEVSLRTLELLDFIEDRFEPKEIVLVSGYRSPEFNEDLRAGGARAAQSSLHTEGLAADVAFRGIGLKKLWTRLRELKLGGVGYYARDGFLHIDSGRPRFWEPQTSKVEQNLSRGNARIFARTEFDRYGTLDGAVIRLHSVTALPLLVAREVEFGADRLRLTPLGDDVAWKDDCVSFADPSNAYRLRVESAPPSGPRVRAPIRLRTCVPRIEATPETIETNPVEVVGPAE